MLVPSIKGIDADLEGRARGTAEPRYLITNGSLGGTEDGRGEGTRWEDGRPCRAPSKAWERLDAELEKRSVKRGDKAGGNSETRKVLGRAPREARRGCRGRSCLRYAAKAARSEKPGRHVA